MKIYGYYETDDSDAKLPIEIRQDSLVADGA